jgi:hypothetical protein
MTDLHPSHPHYTLYKLACFRAADLVPSFFSSFYIYTKSTSKEAFFFLGVSHVAPYSIALSYKARFRKLSGPLLVHLRKDFARPRHALYPDFAAVRACKS